MVQYQTIIPPFQDPGNPIGQRDAETVNLIDVMGAYSNLCVDYEYLLVELSDCF